MNAESINDETFIMVGKYLSGEATPDEAMALEAWLEDPQNEKVYDQFVQLWKQLPASMETTALPNTLVAWNELQNKLATSPINKPITKSWYRYLAAACIVGIMGLIIFLTLNKTNINDQPVAGNNPATTIEAAGSVVTDTLPDGSYITLNKNSKATLASTYNHDKRPVTIEGEGFFDVVPNSSKPFIVSIDDLQVKVVGTSFNVKKIIDRQLVEVQVQLGTVEMYTATEKLRVTKGETGYYDLVKKQMRLQHSFDVNNISYATKTFQFNDIPLAEAARYLQQAFIVPIHVDTASLSDCRITAAFSGKTLPYILDVINATLNTTYQHHNNAYYITGKGCK